MIDKGVLLANLPFFDRNYLVHKEMQSGMGYKVKRSGDLNKKRKVLPICDLLYGAAILKKNNVKFFLDDDQFFDSKDFDSYFTRLSNKIKDPQKVIIRTSFGTINSDIEICKRLKNEWPKSKFIVFGPVFSSNEILDLVKNQKFYDSIIVSEIESVLLDIIEDKKSIPGKHDLVSDEYKILNKEIKYTEMDLIPPPAYDLVDFSQLDALIIQTQRGCPVGCSYCPYFLSQKNKFRAKKPQTVIKELQYLTKKFGFKEITIHDPILSLDIKRLKEICDLIIKNKIDISWQCETHLNHINEETLNLMKKAGCTKMSMGIESANPDVLDLVNRRFKDWDKAKKIINFCKKIGIKTRGYFLLGMPGDSVKGTYMSIELSQYLDLDEANFNLPIPIPGTDPYNRGVKLKILDLNLKQKDPESFFEELSCHSSGNDLSLTKKISNRQLNFISKIAIHSFNYFRGQKGFLRINFLKIFIYRVIVYMESFLGEQSSESKVK